MMFIQKLIKGGKNAISDIFPQEKMINDIKLKSLDKNNPDELIIKLLALYSVSFDPDLKQKRSLNLM